MLILVACESYPAPSLAEGVGLTGAADHERLLAAIDAIGVRHRTAIGDGLMEAVAALPGRVRPLPDGMLPPLPPGPRPQGS